MNKIDIVFCDLDLTFLKTDKSISEENLNAINKLKKQKVLFVPVSGRTYFLVKKVTDQLGLASQSQSYMIGANGAIITTAKGEIIDANPLQKNYIKKLIRLANEEGIAFTLSSKEELVCFRRNLIDISNPKETFLFREIDLEEIQEKGFEEIFKIAFVYPDHSYLLSLQEKVLEATESNVALHFSSTHVMEITAKGFNKGSAIEKVCQWINVPLTHALAIGDNQNDISMLKKCGYSACPYNADPEVKKIVSYVSPLDNDHHAVSDILNQFVL